MTTPQYHASDASFAALPEARLTLTVPTEGPAARRWTRRQWIPAALCSVTGLLMGGRYAVGEIQAHRQRLAFLRLQDQMRADLVRASAQDTAALAPLRAGLVRRLQAALSAGLAAVPVASAPLGSFADCFHLIVRQGMDSIHGTTSAQDFISARLGPVAEASVQMHAAVDGALGALAHEVSGRSHQLAARWLQSAEQLPMGVPGGGVIQSLALMVGRTDTHVREVRTAAVLGLADLGLAALMNRNLLLPVLRRFADRAVNMAGANLALAVADGPLPFGECVALLGDIGFSLWTAWDIFWLSRGLPGRIAQSLREELHAGCDQALAAFDQAAPKLLEAVRQQRQQSAAPLLALRSSTLTPHV